MGGWPGLWFEHGMAMCGHRDDTVQQYHHRLPRTAQRAATDEYGVPASLFVLALAVELFLLWLHPSLISLQTHTKQRTVLYCYWQQYVSEYSVMLIGVLRSSTNRRSDRPLYPARFAARSRGSSLPGACFR